MRITALLVPGLIDALQRLPRVGPSPIKYTRLVYVPEEEGLDGLPEYLKKHIRAAPDAPECPLTANELQRVFAYYRTKGSSAWARTKKALNASFIFGDNNISIKLGSADGGLLNKMQAQVFDWAAAGFTRPAPEDRKQWTVEEYAYVATVKLLAYYDDTYNYLLDKGIEPTQVHIQIYRPGYTGKAHFDTRMKTNKPGTLGRLLVPAKGDEKRALAFYVARKGHKGFPDMRHARLLTLASGRIFMTDLGAGGSPILAAGQVELGHKGDDAHASEVFLAHSPYPKGKPALTKEGEPKRAATCVFTGKPFKK